MHSIVRLRPPVVRRRGGTLHGEVLWVDTFGNLTTNVSAADLRAAGFRGQRLCTTIGSHVVPIRSSYASVPPGRPVALVNSSGLLEVAVNIGSAAAHFDARPGTKVAVGAHRVP
jgi:S-adenosylmethionine hydrolase